MSDDKEFIFKINAYTPKTMPMARLAEYMADLATLLGEKDKVHFEELVHASTGLKYNVEHEAEPKVRERIRLVHNNSAPVEAQNAFKAINKRLKEDNGDAVIKEGSAEIIAFPGIKETVVPVFGPVTQSGSVDGTIIRMGGKNDVVPVTILSRDGLEIKGHAKKHLAIELKHHMFETEMRFSGNGKWTRNEEGAWILESFIITGFEQFEGRTLTETVSELRNVKGSGWSNIDDPWKELKDLRED